MLVNSFLYRARECLIGLIIRTSVLEGSVVEPNGAIPRAIERLTNARSDVVSDTKSVYKSSINLLNDIQVLNIVTNDLYK